MAGPGALGAGWAGDVALDVASAWGRRFVLADGGLEHPVLHRAAGVSVDEGLSDLLLWGASVKRVSRKLDGGGFLITAGTAVAEGSTAFADPRWRSLCQGFRDAGVTFAVLVPAEAGGALAVLEEADDVVLIAGQDEDVASSLAAGADRIRAVVGRDVPAPAGAETPASAAEEPAPPGLDSVEPSIPDFAEEELAAAEALEFDDASVWEPAALAPDDDTPMTAFGAFPLEELDSPDEAFPTVPAEDVPAEDVPAEDVPAEDDRGDDFPAGDLMDDQVPAAPESDAWSDPLLAERAAGDVESTPDEVDPLDRVPPTPSFEEIVEDARVPSAPRGGRRTAFLAVLLVLVLAVAGAAYLGYLNVPGLTPAAEETTPVPPENPPVATAPAAETSPVQAFSVALGAYQDAAVATERAASLAASVSGVLFITAPVDVSGTVFHRVLAGPAQDSAGALELASRVAATSGADPSRWVARRTPRAFQLGETPELDAAQRRSDVLDGLGIPAYILAVDYDDGTVRYRVYAGAYADESEASYLSGLLQERGLSTATLSDRIGRLPE